MLKKEKLRRKVEIIDSSSPTKQVEEIERAIRNGEYKELGRHIVWKAPKLLIAFAILILLYFIAGIGALLFGHLFAQGWKAKLIVVGCSVIAIATVRPLADFYAKLEENTCYRYCLSVFKDCVVAIKFPLHFIEFVDTRKVLSSKEAMEGMKGLKTAYKAEKGMADEKTFENFKNNSEYCILLRSVAIHTTDKSIELSDDERQIVLPYDKEAFEFLKKVIPTCQNMETPKLMKQLKIQTKKHEFKELKAAVMGIIAGYFFKLFAVMLSSIYGNEEIFIWDFVPNIPIILAIAPAVFWLMCGLFRVSWMKSWMKLSVIGLLGFLVPFTLISIFGITILNTGNIFASINFWGGNFLASIVIMMAFGFPLSKKISKYIN